MRGHGGVATKFATAFGRSLRQSLRGGWKGILVFPRIASKARLQGMSCLIRLWLASVVQVLLVLSWGLEEVPAKVTQFANGEIAFPLSDAEKGEGNSLVWKYKPTRWGMYDVVLLRSPQARFSEVVVEVAGKRFGITPPKGFTSSSLHKAGTFYLEKAEPFEIRLRSEKGESLSNYAAVVLYPGPEGKAINVQEGDEVRLHARDSFVRGVTLRYEPATNKNCLGYWSNPADKASWLMDVRRPGTYEIELWQGCGKGQGGSAARLKVHPPHPLQHLLIKEGRFVVEDTGHFQNFVARNLGQVSFASTGLYTVAVEPITKKGVAVMDIREIVFKRVEADTPVRNPGLESLLTNQRVVFYGDSITHGGEYIAYLETYLRLRHPGAAVNFINLGLPSETVSGLSEPGHAGGQFARPQLAKRLFGTFKTKPEVMFLCYGMNDGIYHPYSEERAEAYQKQMLDIHRRAQFVHSDFREKPGALVVHLTPPTFDPVPIKERTLPAGRPEYPMPYEGYNEVLDRYSEWLVGMRPQGAEVIDVHTTMNKFLAEEREKNPKFMLAGDGVHANEQGHWIMAREILKYIGASEELTSAPTPEALTQLSPKAPQLLKLVRERQQILRDAWLTETGHERPGLPKGKPIVEAERLANELVERMKAL